jgi:ribosome-binding factor A
VTSRREGRFQPLQGPERRVSRVERVAEQLRQEIATLMVTEMKDPRVRMASVSRVRVTADLKSATVMISALGEEKERHLVISAMRHAEGYLRAELGHRLENLKTPPRLRFELDESIAYSVHISSMLREMDVESPAEPEGEA